MAGVATITVMGVRAYRAERRLVDEITMLRNQVYEARVSADSCRNELAYQETLFRRFDEVVDSLRQEVRAFEAMDARGVPEAQYEEYLTRFEGYNDSVQAWERRAAELRASEQICRGLVHDHNALADSLRGRLTEMAPEG